MKVHEFQTRKGLLEQLELDGVRGHAADAIVAETAPYRHAMRVAKAREAALEAAEQLFGEDIRAGAEALRDCSDEPDAYGVGYVAAKLAAHAALLCLLDCAGHGGRDGVEGLSTSRLPCFRGLGKGRKQASDGGAWTAAIREAADRLLPGARVYAPDGAVGLGLCNAEGSITVRPQTLVDAGLAPQAMTVAREGLRLACGLEPWLVESGIVFAGVDREYTGTGMPPAEAWAELVNGLASCCEADVPEPGDAADHVEV
jgi:hypothetical protein